MDSIGSPLLWGAFLGFVLLMLALDLGVFHRKAHAVRPKEALIWSGVWIALSLVFNAFVWWRFGGDRGDRVPHRLPDREVALGRQHLRLRRHLLRRFGVPAEHQHRVLFWGILGALVLRAVMIFAGAALIERFHWLIYVFGGVPRAHRRRSSSSTATRTSTPRRGSCSASCAG